MFKPLFKGHRETCYFCDHVWGECTCEFPEGDDAPGFLDKDSGVFIIEPNVSITKGEFVDPVVFYGQAYVDCALGDAWTHWPVK